MNIMNEMRYAPGSLVRVRSREWVVQPESNNDILALRPLGGSDDDIQVIIPSLEFPPVEPAIFELPDPEKPGAHDSALLLRDALRLKLRATAGPFRSFGNISVEPRAYQLVPLLMALKLQPVRLLIADDVGIGKTIEAGLIIRELIDRGEISRFSVLCPPHLVDQWVQELQERFHLSAVAVTSTSVSKLERETPPGQSLFVHYKAHVISLDFIKSDRHKDQFLANVPEMIIIDEAHTCTIGTKRAQKRWKLVQELAKNPERHLLLLTATPHSGDTNAFRNLLSLLDQRFGEFDDESFRSNEYLSKRLADHFVQRRRIDICDEWKDPSIFPTRKSREATYKLSGQWASFFREVRDYCTEMATKAERAQDDIKSVFNWYAILALLRCISSSPAAAISALSKPFVEKDEDFLSLIEASGLDDFDESDEMITDTEPATALKEDPKRVRLIKEAIELRGIKGDPKLECLSSQVRALLGDGFIPIVFCRYISTAHYVAEHLKDQFPEFSIDAITGEYTPEERKERILQLQEAEKRILVATDCLSEGINLQEGFDAVIHYDLAWNPTRHEQREGRVDRFGQKSREVRCIIIYGQDNPVDGFILNVILKKAQRIKDDTGVIVPLPEDKDRISIALIKSTLLRSRSSDMQLEFDFDELLEPIETAWSNAEENAKVNRSRFAQHRIKPEEVWPEWKKQSEHLGNAEDSKRFVQTALKRAGSPLESLTKGAWKFSPQYLPPSLRERFIAHGFAESIAISFTFPSAPQARYIHRSNPIISLIADAVLESALDESALSDLPAPLASRASAFETTSVSKLTRIYLIRLRHQLTFQRQIIRRQLLAEESIAIGVEGVTNPRLIEGEAAEVLLEAHPSGNLSRDAMVRTLIEARRWYLDNRSIFEDLAKSRAEILLTDHRRVRDASVAQGSYAVKPCLPVDLVGMYVLLPKGF